MLISIYFANLGLAVVGVQPAGLVHLAAPQRAAGSTTSSDITVVYKGTRNAVRLSAFRAVTQTKVCGTQTKMCKQEVVD